MGAQRKHPGLAEGAGRGRTARPWAQEGWDYSFLFVPACTVPGTQQVFNWYLKGQKARPAPTPQRSEERRVGKECRSRWSPYH